MSFLAITFDDAADKPLLRYCPKFLQLKQKGLENNLTLCKTWLRGKDLNQRPSGYEPDELPGCSTPRYVEVGLCIRFKSVLVKHYFFLRRDIKNDVVLI